ncbi:MAG: hypothetical protein A2Y67_03305 [Candidatus Buchananbacteria bacterium RBG_13_39_9]|uniref:Phosphoribosyltransferase domain-containing protein n=1 Tax=Candidatus Buchananbacteria bacterium RBG_13_39_9 TaxID=1797531 RepID=A0A1G1XP23_9BACT|nr:MAG: hypothetical protein A2Y67_03305 [Candidatus Buchananbacteria bacterium RBG_13_39_9]
MDESEVLSRVKNGGVFDLPPRAFDDRRMTIAEAEAIFTAFNSFWQYKGNPIAEKPHALLKSGKHSNGFIACKDFLKYPQICLLFANEIVKRIRGEVILSKISKLEIDAVVSSAYSAINLGWEVARLLSEHNEKIEYIPVEKDEKGNPTIIRGGIDPGKKVLVINELMTTGSGSTWETKEAVLKCNGDKPAPKVIEPALVLVHRSKEMVLADGSPVQPVFHFDIGDSDVPKGESCPYCDAGSEAIKPKLGNNWQRLHGLA